MKIYTVYHNAGKTSIRADRMIPDTEGKQFFLQDDKGSTVAIVPFGLLITVEKLKNNKQ